MLKSLLIVIVKNLDYLNEIKLSNFACSESSSYPPKNLLSKNIWGKVLWLLWAIIFWKLSSLSIKVTSWGIDKELSNLIALLDQGQSFKIYAFTRESLMIKSWFEILIIFCSKESNNISVPFFTIHPSSRCPPKTLHPVSYTHLRAHET